MQEHQQTLSYAIALVASRPETSPLPQSIGCACRATANGLVNSEPHLDDTRILAVGTGTHCQHLPDEDDVGDLTSGAERP